MSKAGEKESEFHLGGCAINVASVEKGAASGRPCQIDFAPPRVFQDIGKIRKLLFYRYSVCEAELY